MSHRLTDKEHATMKRLQQAWNAFIELPIDHPDEQAEFRHGIHALQNAIMARPTARLINEEINPAASGLDVEDV